MTERKIKRARYTSEPVYVINDGVEEPYIPKEIITNRDAYSLSLDMLFKHVADFHMLMIEIIAEKTGLDAKEIVTAIQDDPRAAEMKHTPRIHSLGVIEKKDVEKVVEVVPDVEEIETKLNTITIGEKAKKPTKPKIVRKGKV
jgi:hypothetical protein